MTKQILRLFLLVFAILSVQTALRAQLRVVQYSENFMTGTTYCPGSSNYDNWVSFRRLLDTSTIKFTQVTIQGDNNATAMTGRTCSDVISVRRLADAIRNGNAYNVSCGGNTWDISGAGSCVAAGCALGTDQVAISVRGAGTFCQCANPAWSLNACIGNQNWGGINTANCPPPTQRITMTFLRPATPRDMGATRVASLDQCTYTQDIFATFTSGSNADIDSFQYYLRVNTTTYGPYKAKVKIRPDSSVNVRVFSGFTFTRNTFYNISVWSANANYAGADPIPGNDTSKTTLDFKGTLATPVAIDTVVCGSQRVNMRAIPGNVADPLVWFSDRNGAGVVGYGNRIQSPFLASGATYKFWVGSYNGLRAVRATLGAGTNGQSGAMFDIRALSGDLTIDSIHFESRTTAGTPVQTEVYLRRGSYLDAGAASTASMWTRIFSGTVTSRGTGLFTTMIPVSIKLPAGQQHAIYVVTPNDIVGYMTGAGSFNNADVTISGGYGIAGTFGGVFNPRHLNGAVFYTKPICPSALDSAIITVNPAPFGAKMSAGVPFKTSPRRSGTGAKGLPQVVAMGDTLAWNLDPPTGYNNAGHNTTWKIKSTSLKTEKGRVLTNYTWTDPTSSAAGRFVYTPDTSVIDSNLVGTVTFQDLGTYKCDSTVVFYMYVAPLPVPDYTRSTKICDGDAIEFVNKSTIKKGFLEYKWYFGDGDSTDAMDPIHVYSTYGTYYLKYNAISSIYGYVRTKLDTIVVTRLPQVDFKVFNVCEKQTHRFVNNTSATGTVTYKWNFGTAPGVQSTQKDPTFRYTVPGQYRVTLTAEANGCPASLTKNAYLFPKPKAAFSFPSAPGTKFCSNVAVPFTNNSTVSSGALGQSWSFGDGEVGTVANPNHLFKTGGNFDVRLIAITPFGCADTTSKPIVVGSAPVVTWTNGQVCDQTPTQFNNGTAAISGFTSSPMWYFGDGATSGADNPQHQYTVLGPKTVKLVVSVNNGCKDSMSKTLSVGTQAIADFTAAATCSGKPVQFENKSTWKQGNATYEWEFGDGNTSNVADPVHTYTTSSSFVPNVKLKVTIDGACETVVTKPLQVYELPSCAFTVTDDWTPGEGYRTVRVQAVNTTYPFYRFKFSDGGSINAAGGVYQFPYEGDFTIQMSARNQADCECTQSQTKAIRNSVGTESLSAGQVRVYPNPSSGVLNVESGSQIRKVEVFNVLGETVQTGQSVSGQKAVIRFGEVSNGVYLVKVTTDQGVVTRRITVNK